ncbi:MAG: PD-(D/E)XK nuclease family protein [Candidatus Obscuribacterales bacterium]
MNHSDSSAPSTNLSAPPAIIQLKTISPSRFQSLALCQLRELWNSSLPDSKRHLPPWPAARVGTIIHKLLELAAKGKIHDNVEHCWRELVSQSEDDLANSWVTRPLIPLSRTQPSFEVRMYRALRKATEVVGKYVSSAAPQSQFGPEIKVKSRDGTVRGAIDLVRPGEAGPVIVDYKTGTIFETDNNAFAVIKPEYVTQMTLYAALYHEQFDTWPSGLELVPLRGQTVRLSFDTSKAAELLEEAKDSLRAVNAKVEQHTSISELASLSPENCKFCQHRPVCPAYREHAPTLASAAFPFDEYGKLVAIHRQTDELVSLQMRTANGDDREIKDIVYNFDRHPTLAFVDAGSNLAIFNLKQDIRFNQYIEMPALTTIYTFNDST